MQIQGYPWISAEQKPQHKVSSSTVPERSSFQADRGSEVFWDARPSIGTTVNVTSIISGCAGSEFEGWRNTSRCLKLLRDEKSYHLTTDSKSSTCGDFEACKYHTYWRGPLTWRVSFTIKSFLYTQNLNCSQLHLWLDADFNPAALQDAMDSPVLKPFLPLVQSNLLVLRSWTFPRSIPILDEYCEGRHSPDGMLHFDLHHIPRGPVAVSDSVRFIVLHLEGGFYMDMDTMLLRDLRPLLITPDLAFAERWSAHSGDGEYNTAYLRLQPQSRLSSMIIQRAAKMGMNFHPRVLGRMLAKSGHGSDLVMFETALFDPLWSQFDKDNTGSCCVPCLTDFSQFFQQKQVKDEWISLDESDRLYTSETQSNIHVISNNRTLSNFYRGAYAHHIHNQWERSIVPGSWAWVADQTYNQFLLNERPNLYGEEWARSKISFEH